MVDKAIAEFQAILATAPDNLGANRGAGFALYSTGDKKNFQKAANYLQHYVDIAPETDMDLPDVKAMLAALKNFENVTPQKTTPGPVKRP